MSKKTFTEREIKKLSQNRHVKSVSTKGITYTEDFKRIFIVEYEKGKAARQIFEESGFEIEVIGMPRVKSSGKRWLAAYRDNGVVGLRDTRKGNSGRQSDKELSIENKYARLEAVNNLLKAENELLKKIDFFERRMKK